MLFAISDVVWQALIAAVLAGLLEWMRRDMNWRARVATEEVKEEVGAVKTDVGNVRSELNGQLSAWKAETLKHLEVVAQSKYAEGLLDGRAAEKLLHLEVAKGVQLETARGALQSKPVTEPTTAEDGHPVYSISAPGLKVEPDPEA